MIAIPALDIMGGRCVRLTRGKFEESVVYADDIWLVASYWERSGAPLLHVVDLDSARAGRLLNFGLISALASLLSIPVEYGGGVRTMDDCEMLFAGGVSRVVLGSAVVRDPALLEGAVKKFGGSVLASVDVVDGTVAVSGWRESTEVDLQKAIREVVRAGVKEVVVTDITRDGTLCGPNVELYKWLENNCPIGFYASGGISSVDDALAVARAAPTKCRGIIIGKALYEGKIKYQELCQALKQLEQGGLGASQEGDPLS